jgi:hypothetical protein
MSVHFVHKLLPHVCNRAVRVRCLVIHDTNSAQAAGADEAVNSMGQIQLSQHAVACGSLLSHCVPQRRQDKAFRLSYLARINPYVRKTADQPSLYTIAGARAVHG